jgi:hypothetical protein
MTTAQTSKLRLALERHAELAGQKLTRRHPHVSKWFEKRGLHPKQIRHHAKKLASVATLAGTMFLSNPMATQLSRTPIRLVHNDQHKLQDAFAANLKALLPSEVRPITPSEEEAIEKLVKLTWGISAKAEYEGERLNISYGYIGAEQHLPRYPGDIMEPTDENQQSGITPGRGAWGYFAPSKAEMTPDLYEKEKYYVAVQTLYLSDWKERLPYLRDWYKYRKVIVMNPKNGKMIAAVVADAGPAQWTGKSFGGSPEVMHYLEAKDGKQRGPVVLFFADDPDNKIPLGPIENTKDIAMGKESSNE